jgi:hypothetical protein
MSMANVPKTPIASSARHSLTSRSTFVTCSESIAFISFLVAVLVISYLAQQDSGGQGQNLEKWPALGKLRSWNHVSITTEQHGKWPLTEGGEVPKPPADLSCEQWLLQTDGPVVPGGRDFDKEPVMIFEAALPPWFEASEEELRVCDVKCR